MRMSVLKRFAFTSFVALAIATVISLAFSRMHNLNDAMETCTNMAEIATRGMSTRLKEYNYETICDPAAPGYADFRNDMRTICRNNQLLYLYIFDVDLKTGARDVYVCVASDDVLDKVERTGEQYGEWVNDPLNDAEIQALKSGFSADPYITTYGPSEQAYCYYRKVHLKGNEGRHTLIGCEINALEVVAEVNDNTLSYAVPMTILMCCLVGYEVYLLKRHVSDPLGVVARCMRVFTSDQHEKRTSLVVTGDSEIVEIISSFNQLQNEIDDYTCRISDMKAANQAVQTELEVASRIQEGIVPPRSLLRGQGYEGFAVEEPAREVGGDFYLLRELEDGRVLVCVADVSSKGVVAALFMAQAQALMMYGLKQKPEDPAAVLNTFNNEMLAYNPVGMFVTVFAGSFDPKTGILTYANAGHTRAYVVGRGYLDADPGVALGIFEDSDIVNGTLELARGEGIVLYTDGVTEAVSADRQFFGEERLAACLADVHTTEEAVNAVIGAVSDFVGDNEQFDDCTLLVLFRTDDPVAS